MAHDTATRTDVEVLPMTVAPPEESVLARAARVLDAAADRIAEEARWMQSALCLDGRACAVGAIAIEALREGGDDERTATRRIEVVGRVDPASYSSLVDSLVYRHAYDAARTASRKRYGLSLWNTNDSTVIPETPIDGGARIVHGRTAAIRAMRQAAADLRGRADREEARRDR